MHVWRWVITQCRNGLGNAAVVGNGQAAGEYKFCKEFIGTILAKVGYHTLYIVQVYYNKIINVYNNMHTLSRSTFSDNSFSE